MPPFPVFLQMDTGPAPSPSSVVVGPSSLWRLAERRSRKAGSGNIFSSVNLWQLQRLFRAAGDQDAEQRAQLVWGHGDEAELAQALIGLRARSHRRGLRTNGRDALGSHWLRAFNHLRIGESSPSSQGRDAGEENHSEAGAHSSPEPHQHPVQHTVGATGRGTGATVVLTESHSHVGMSERPVRVSSGLRRGGESDPERYLHRILH
ncbi:arginine vasopressin-induced protein 1 [Toxotes jaculatrix]|uniref:arginine vasopressin-induced protein 1 n=1 Tax=Toxotes jaculatrix TaxID=941984 RepID=UPI001B3AEC26|nr:arginine vasopressin-induced protein 1 [Toxotes jaculatrix]